jgi:hypothetical protein
MNTVTQTSPVQTQMEEGPPASLLDLLSREATKSLPDRYADLKKEIWKDSFVQSWQEVLAALETAVDEVSTKGGLVSFALYCGTNGKTGPCCFSCRLFLGFPIRTSSMVCL